MTEIERNERVKELAAWATRGLPEEMPLNERFQVICEATANLGPATICGHRISTASDGRGACVDCFEATGTVTDCDHVPTRDFGRPERGWFCGRCGEPMTAPVAP